MVLKFKEKLEDFKEKQQKVKKTDYCCLRLKDKK